MAPLPCFEELKAMAERDPDAFEAFRENFCEAFIDSIPNEHQPRLRAVQFRVNTVISRAKTPMAGLIKVSGMMHDSLATLSERIYELHEQPREAQSALCRPDNVVDIHRWRRDSRAN